MERQRVIQYQNNNNINNSNLRTKREQDEVVVAIRVDVAEVIKVEDMVDSKVVVEVAVEVEVVGEVAVEAKRNASTHQNQEVVTRLIAISSTHQGRTTPNLKDNSNSRRECQLHRYHRWCNLARYSHHKVSFNQRNQDNSSSNQANSSNNSNQANSSNNQNYQ